MIKSALHKHGIYYAIILSALLHAIWLFHSSADKVTENETDLQSTVMQVELMPHVNAASASKLLKRIAAIHHEVIAEESVANVNADELKPSALNEDIIGSVSAADSTHEQFVSLLHQAIDQNTRYPLQAKRQHRGGKVKLRFMVHPDGLVSDVSVVESSHFALLDDAARDAVNSISPFQLAENYINEQKIYDVDIDFRLN